MARHFNGSSDKVTLSPGGLTTALGAVTIAGICQRTTSAANKAIIEIDGSGFAEFLVLSSGAGAANCIQYVTDTGNRNTVTMTLVTADGWCLIAVTKAAGTATPRFHKYKFSTNAWTHENGGGTMGDETGTNTFATIGTGGSDWWNGDIAAVGVWRTAFSDAQIENLAFNLSPWFQIQPDALWVLDQSATGQNVVDISGGGANQSGVTGTTIATSSVPVFNYGDGVWLPGGPAPSVATVTSSAADFRRTRLRRIYQGA